ncbi:hypothetical protein [Microlunatus speluncae]|uniref:hypothetical protein n=1 Tax=Microlunatus speluncae TaxID=2594267 RepID=UPI001C2D55CD|nr:hypothetical protein [Microlunatus speluncae]
MRPGRFAATMKGPKGATMNTVLTASRAAVGALPRIWIGARPLERLWYVVAGVLFAGGLGHVAVLLLTGASWEGPTSLRKAATFGLSFGLTLATVVWASSFIRLGSWFRAAVLSIFTVVCVLETVLITLQAWRGVPSHFNFETPFDTSVSMTLAGGGFVIIAVGLILAGAALRRTADLTPELRLALRYGFGTLLAAFGTGAIMIATGVTLARSGDPAAAYATAGFLKPLHAVALHAILVLPGLAWLIGFTGWDAGRRLRVVRWSIMGYSVLLVGAVIISLVG